MKTEIKNPLISTQPKDTFDRVNGMIDLLRAIDYTGIGLTESSEIAQAHILDLMQHALEYESGRCVISQETAAA